MREINYTCPYCAHKFTDKYMATEVKCRHCNKKFEIRWLSNGQKRCGIVNTTLVCFWGATGKIDLPNNITKIAAEVFSNCPKLIEVVLPNSIQEIGEGAFSNCYRLSHVELPKSLKIIEKRAFLFSGLRTLFIPESVEQIANDAFGSCLLLKNIEVHENNPYYYIKNNALFDKRTEQLIVSRNIKPIYKITVDSYSEEDKSETYTITQLCDFDKRRIAQALTTIANGLNKFIICESDTPINGITYLQATNEDEKIYVEFHLQKSPDDTVWENWSCLCDLDKCNDYFFSFLQGSFTPEFDNWELCIKEGDPS